MRSFLRYLTLLLVSLAALTLGLPRVFNVPYPAQAGPTFDNAVRSRYTNILEEYQVELALMGDSVLEQGVDGEALSEALDVPSYAIAVPGSTAPFWYLILKNIILEAEPRPDAVLILYRDTILTLPDFHVNGGYVNELDQFATAREDVLIERAYLNFMNPLEKFALAWFPLYSSRQQVTDLADYYARNLLPALLSACRGECLDRAHAAIFHIDNVVPEFQEAALVEDEEFLFTARAMDFHGTVEESFLPEIIRLCRENGIRLILVHERTLLFANAAAEPKALREYKSEMAEYLEANEVPLIDFSYDPRLPEEYFTDVLHMNAAGKAAFTQLLSEALMPMLQAEP
ncbi:MAG: hypothetical protein C4583_13750 [Anaerolineaceae bacterium]|nr:MAG: hypothetical protein C4583_13750 [Anaerolineaceae bacterium]